MKKIFLFSLLLLQTVNLMAEDLDSLYAKDLLKPGTEVPALSLRNYKGEKRSLSDYRGQYVVLDFWASWCPDCRKDIPAMAALHQAYRTKNVKFFGVSFDTDSIAWQQCVRENNMFWTQVCGYQKMRDSQIAKDFGVKWIPSMYLIDPEGKVVLGTVDIEKLSKALSALNAEEKPELVLIEKMPCFVGGNKALIKALSRNLKYPKKAQTLDLEGKVVVSFIVDKDGSIQDVQEESIQLNALGATKAWKKLNDAERELAKEEVKELFKNEAIRVVKEMPKWIPGENKGEPIRVKYRVPVTFHLY